MPTSTSMSNRSAHSIHTFSLSPALPPVPRIFTGLWQLSSNAWGSASVPKIRKSMARHVHSGYTAFDMADHYGPAEVLFGQFRASLPAHDQQRIVGATKWCVFTRSASTCPPSPSTTVESNASSDQNDVINPNPTAITPAFVLLAVQERLKRMRADSVDLLQFHWHDYSDKQYLTALQYLSDIVQGKSQTQRCDSKQHDDPNPNSVLQQHRPLISALGLCNFDSLRTDEICHFLGPGKIVSNQVQFSLIDTRPLALDGMSHVCEKHGLKLLTYGTLCGGFLSDKWLGQSEPEPYGIGTGALTPSQRKYLDMITRAWGTWDLFQSLLVVLRLIADRHSPSSNINISIANIATRWVLDHSFVGAVIIGARLGLSEHLASNSVVFSFSLTPQDKTDIDAVLARSNSHSLVSIIGDCGAEYRDGKSTSSS